MKRRVVNIFLLLFVFDYSIAQTALIIPQKGIAGIPVIIDSTGIAEVFRIFGREYQLTENRFTTVFKYASIGLSFTINPCDKNEIVRSIIIESPYKAKTKEGISLNESTMNDVWNLYGERSYFSSGDYAWRPQKGISFYTNKNPDKKKYNPGELINKIEINNKDSTGSSSQLNFEYNRLPAEQKRDQLITILNKDPFSFDELNVFLEKEKENKEKPYAIEVREPFSRELEFGIKQDYFRIVINRDFYKLNIIRNSTGIVYVRLSDKKIWVERTSEKEINRIISLQNSRTNLFYDISNPMDFPAELFDYGTFCGLHGSPPQKCNEMLELVRQGNYKELSIWLKSMNPEIAAYGYAGLYFLNESGIELEKTEIEQMKHLKTLTIKLNNCRGCFFGREETIKSLLSDKELKSNYFSFRQSRFL